MSRRVQLAKQAVKALPGSGPARRRVLAAVRGNDVLRRLVRRIYHVDQNVPAPLDITPGTLVEGVGTETLPVTLVLVLGTDGPTFGRVVTEVAHLQRVTAGFRPVLVTDVPGFAAVRRFGYPLELLVPEADFDPVLQGRSWAEYARERIALLLASYRATVTVTGGPEGLAEESRLLLSALRPATADAAAED